MRFVKDNLLPNSTVELIITNYEVALRDVLISSFPEARYAGYWFYYNQVKINNQTNIINDVI